MLELSEKQIAWIEAPHLRSLWGQQHRVNPKFIRQALGDGGRLLGVSPLNSRPDYYVIRVDSNWRLDHTYTEAGDCVGDHMDEIYEAIEDECGNASDWMDDDPPGDPEAPEYQWPALDEDCGSTWFAYTPPDSAPAYCV